ncbi:MAG: hypothetical protein JWO38_615 [Gemmataceae bacterium]|nr:hypothetical protein [Gemmataceae bacterium]
MRTAALFTSSFRSLVAVACLIAAVGPAVAAPPKVKITDARVGLPPHAPDDPSATPVCKFAAWAPVYVDLEVLDGVTDPAELVVETPDADGVVTTLAVPLDLARVRPGTTLSARDLKFLPYLRPAGGTGETTVTVRTTAGTALSDPFRIRSLRPRAPLVYVVLSLGSRLPGFDLPRATSGTDEAEPATGPVRGGRVELASITDPDTLPDQWFGYEAADLVVLTTGTGSAEFLRRLFDDPVKRQALLEWVRRGGRLVVSVGVNAGAAAQLPALQDVLPYSIKTDAPVQQVARLPLYWSARETSQAGPISGNLTAKGTTVPVANLAPKAVRAARVLIPPPDRQRGEDREAVAVQAGYGLGRVTLVAFDLDRPPFTEFAQRQEFWDWVLRQGGADRASVGGEGKIRAAASGPTDDEDEVAVSLRTHVDTFDGVPVISFAWVAVLIGLYILLIGPLEYYFLTKVFGRLELTWATFPVIVLTVCVAAYLTAAAAKGRELRVNKMDVVEVAAEFDPRTGRHGGRLHGTTWFTVFSPKLDAYTVGVTPAEGWTAGAEPGAALVGWLGGPRAGRAGLIRRRYAYHVDLNAGPPPGESAVPGVMADGLEGVPVQTWSTKSFTAEWTGAIDPAAPVVESRLEHPVGDPSRAIGTFVNRMPFPAVTDCVAFYAGQAYPIGTIVNGQEVRLVLDRGVPASQWLQEKGQLPDLLGLTQSAAPGSPPGAARAGTDSPAAPPGSLPLMGLLFHEAALRHDEGVIPRNASLRRLDQSWRLAQENRAEVIVVGRVLPPRGPAEDLFGGPASPSRVWLKGLPGPGKDRPAVPGTGRQETYVRLYLPVLPAGVLP